MAHATLLHSRTLVSDRCAGSFTYKHAVGNDGHGEGNPIAEDAVFQLASSTKLLTSIAALQIVEEGLVGLDDDVAGHLPELCEQPILKGFDDDDRPILEKRKNPITLRYRGEGLTFSMFAGTDRFGRILLTHTSGCAYDAIDPNLAKYRQQNGDTVGTGATIEECYLYPLIFEPGTQFM